MWRAVLVIMVISSLFSLPVFAAEKNENHKLFEGIFSRWTEAFDHKDLPNVCKLFSKHITAKYQGVPTKNYHSLCDGFKKIFSESRTYKYSYRIRQVYRNDDLAVVRVTWFLQISEHGKLVSDTQDEGMDVFRKNKNGSWQIVNYLGYPHIAHAK